MEDEDREEEEEEEEEEKVGGLKRQRAVETAAANVFHVMFVVDILVEAELNDALPAQQIERRRACRCMFFGLRRCKRQNLKDDGSAEPTKK